MVRCGGIIFLLLAAAGCQATAGLHPLEVPWTATREARAAAYQDLGWKAPGPGTVWLVDATDGGRVLGVYEVQAEEAFTFTPRLAKASVEDRPVTLQHRPKFGHEHELYYRAR